MKVYVAVDTESGLPYVNTVGNTKEAAKSHAKAMKLVLKHAPITESFLMLDSMDDLIPIGSQWKHNDRNMIFKVVSHSNIPRSTKINMPTMVNCVVMKKGVALENDLWSFPLSEWHRNFLLWDYADRDQDQVNNS